MLFRVSKNEIVILLSLLRLWLAFSSTPLAVVTAHNGYVSSSRSGYGLIAVDVDSTAGCLNGCSKS
ncbi:hypothetical protein PMIT1303_00002 [Prochlorococcus sp. MIT 1303]|nr:hypothetical protein PMIT1303_00002 [Prochlorococcus sp. MIT 1303]